tara:strand:+ start:970 stop:2109 length:1140 start_codon:yes stop_codon:yes gene_type:complete
MENIYIIGMGYIGFPLACLLSKERKIKCIDKDIKKIEQLKNGKILIKEKNLNKLFKKNFNNLDFKNKIYKEKNRSTFFICVPTPLKKNKPDLSFLNNVLRKIEKFIKKGDLIIIESTIPPGTTENIEKKLSAFKRGINLAYCPEKAIPGNTLYEMINNFRVIGGINTESNKLAKKIYSTFSKKIYLTNPMIAEISKLAENTFRLVNISLANEINTICDFYKVDSSKLFEITNMHPRVNYLKPSIGIGGHCIPIDPLFFNIKKKIKMIETSININQALINKISEDIISKIKEDKKSNILCLGITYKENIDDLRESAALKIIKNLRLKGVKLNIYDPYNSSLNTLNKTDLKKIKFDLKIYLVNHDKFKNLKIKARKSLDYR